MATSPCGAAAAALCAAALLAAPALAAPVALIVDSRGAIIPPAPALTEAEAGATFTLDAAAELIVIHYASCVETHVRGGEVSIGPLGAAGGAEIVAETKIDCPRRAALAPGDGAAEPIPVGARPFIVMLGDEVSEIALERAGAVIGAMDVRGGIARWPARLPPLEPGGAYEIAFAGGGVTRRAPAAVSAGSGVLIVEP